MGMPTNLMHDKRVHRGSTTASVVLHQPDAMIIDIVCCV